MFLVAFLPLALWQWTPGRWHLLLAAVFGVFAAITLGPALRRLVLDFLAWRDAPTRGAYRWHRRWTAAVYGRHLLTYLRQRGWRVISAEVVGGDQVRVVAELGRRRVGLLLVRPGCMPSPADLEWPAGPEAMLVSEAAIAGTARRRIRFRAISQLDETMAAMPAHRIG